MRALWYWWRGRINRLQRSIFKFGTMALTALAAACNTPATTLDAAASSPDAGAPPVTSLKLSGVVDAAPGSSLLVLSSVFVAWDLAAADLGTLYKFGEGNTLGAHFVLQLDTPPPDGALNDGVVAVGNVILVKASYSLADGELSLDDSDALIDAAIGAAGNYAIIYKTGESKALPWLAQFPRGLSCGKGIRPRTGPDSTLSGEPPVTGFAPVDCSTMHLTVGPIEGIVFASWYPSRQTSKAVPAGSPTPL